MSLNSFHGSSYGKIETSILAESLPRRVSRLLLWMTYQTRLSTSIEFNPFPRFVVHVGETIEFVSPLHQRPIFSERVTRTRRKNNVYDNASQLFSHFGCFSRFYEYANAIKLSSSTLDWRKRKEIHSISGIAVMVLVVRGTIRLRRTLFHQERSRAFSALPRIPWLD